MTVCCCLHNMLGDAYGTKSRAANYEPNLTQEPPTGNSIYFSRARGYDKFEGFAAKNSFSAYLSDERRMIWQDHRVKGTDQN